MTRWRLHDLLKAIGRLRSLVIGDAMVDEYIWGVAERVSPEAPVLVVRSEQVTQVPGGAANVVHCLRAMGAGAGLGAVVGDDEAGRGLAQRLTELGADPLVLVADPARPTIVKTRVLAHTQQVVRIDREVRGQLPDDLLQVFFDRCGAALNGCTGLLLSDYDKGVLTPHTIPAIVAEAARRGAPVAVNAKPRNAPLYRDVDLVTVNRFEAEAICGFAPEGRDEARRAADAIVDSIGCGHVLVTLGGEGAVLRAREGEAVHVPAVQVQVFDPAGAGDTTVAAAHLALCAGAEPLEAAQLAMLAAAVVVRKVGVATATAAEILALADAHQELL